MLAPVRLQLTLAAAVLVLAGCATETAGSGSGSAPSPSVSSAPATPETAVTITDPPPSTSPFPSATPTSLRTTTVQNTASGTTYSVTVWAQRKDDTCADHAYGAPMVAFLEKHPCGGLTRLLATTAVDGRAVGFAQSSLGFESPGQDAEAGYRAASDFIRLVSADGTGNIADLLREGARLPAGPTAIPSPDAFSALGQDAGVVVLEAWYLDGPTPENDPPLVTMAQDLFLRQF